MKKFYLYIAWALCLSAMTSCGGGGESTSEAHTIELSKNLTKTPQINYQIGSTWGSKSVNQASLHKLNSFNHSRLASNMVKIRTTDSLGSGFYLGKIRGEHIIATNAHVLGKSIACSIFPVIVEFSLFEKSFSCKNLIGSWMQVDFALFSIKVSPSQERSLFDQLNPLEIDFSYSPTKGEPLISAGHGEYKNPELSLSLNNDEDCKVYSQSNTTALVINPNNQKKKVKSIAIGCDISPGDSGGPILSQDSGQVVGVIWGTKTPKPEEIQNRSFLTKIYHENDSVIWNSLAYMVSPRAIRDELLRWSRRVSVSQKMTKRRLIIEQLIY